MANVQWSDSRWEDWKRFVFLFSFLPRKFEVKVIHGESKLLENKLGPNIQETREMDLIMGLKFGRDSIGSHYWFRKRGSCEAGSEDWMTGVQNRISSFLQQWPRTVDENNGMLYIAIVVVRWKTNYWVNALNFHHQCTAPNKNRHSSQSVIKFRNFLPPFSPIYIHVTFYLSVISPH